MPRVASRRHAGGLWGRLVLFRCPSRVLLLLPPLCWLVLC